MAGYAAPPGAAGPRPTAPPKPQARSSRPNAAPFVAGPQRPQNKNRPPVGNQAHPAPSGVGHWVPQGDNWQLIHAVGKNKWAPTTPGAGSPPKPKGPTPIPNNPLAPLTQNQIKRQATSTITAAYGGANTDLNNQQSQAQNLYKAQKADDDYFGQWLQQQGNNLTNVVNTANDKLTGVLQGVLQTQQDALGAMPGQLAQSGEQGAQAGVGQPGQQAAALTADTAGNINAANAKTAGTVATALNSELGSQNAALAAGGVAQARVATRTNNELGTLNTTLNNIANQRTKLMASQTGDIAKEITRLQGVELSKAQYARSQSDLEQTAGIKNANATTTALAGAKRADATAMNAQTAAKKAAEDARHNQAMEDIANQKGNQAAARQKEIDRHNKVMEGIGQQRVNVAASKGGAKGPVKFGTPTQQRSVVNYVDSVRQALLTDAQRFHSGDPNALKFAYHDLLNGNAAAQGINVGKPPGNTSPTPWLNAATNTLTNLGANGLTPGDIAFLNQQGLQVGSRYPRATPQKPVAPVAANKAQVPGF